MAIDLLPPASTPLERAFADASERLHAIPPDLAALWNPATCPIALLPWLAWALSIDRWEADWSDAEKRAAVADAIAVQRIKGTRAAVETVLASFCDLITMVEWFEAEPALDPYTFEVRLQLINHDGIAGGSRVSAAFARAIVDEVARVKPVRAHFELIQELTLAGAIAPVGAMQATGYRRVEAGLADTSGIDWAALLQDENGEPLTDDAGNTIDGSAA